MPTPQPQVWPALMVGASVHFASLNQCVSTMKLVQWLVTNSITACLLTSSLAHNLFQHPSLPSMPLRVLLFGGDVPIRAPPPGLPFRLISLYGHAETMWVLAYLPPAGGQAQLPLGKPVSGVQLYVLDAHMQLVPIGVDGELYVAGQQLGTGYLGQPELTASVFLPHPFSKRKADRVFKTGDLVRWCRDGTLEFRARADRQIKIRGFRVSLQDVESGLLTHPRVHRVCASETSGARQRQGHSQGGRGRGRGRPGPTVGTQARLGVGAGSSAHDSRVDRS